MEQNNISSADRQEEEAYLQFTLSHIQQALNQLGDAEKRLKGDLYDNSRFLWEELPQQVRSFADAADLSSHLSTIALNEDRLSANILRSEVLQRMQGSPYFGRVDFREEGEEVAKIYIGPSNLMNETDYSMIVCDWRAPVASLFYENGCGKTAYDSPVGRIAGTVERLRQYEIQNGQIKLLIDADLKIDDPILMKALGGQSDNHMRSIVSTIQREQNSVIRDSGHDVLLVLGPAGSGKTSVALHRVAYLIYRDRKELNSNNILIFSPNELFSSYIAGVIPELGEKEVKTTTFAGLITRYCGANVTGMYEQIEFLGQSSQDRSAVLRRLGIALKGSEEFCTLLKQFTAEYVPPFRDLVFRGNVIVSKDYLKELYTVRFSHMLPLFRFEAMAEEIQKALAPIEKRYKEEKKKQIYTDDGFAPGEIHVDIKAKRAFRDEAGDMLATIDLLTKPNFPKLYRKALLYAITRTGLFSPWEKKILVRDVCRTDYNGKLFFEDGVGLLLLKGLFGGIRPERLIRHVVVDEVQDYSPAQHEIFARVFPHCKLTLLGDTDQLINRGMGIADGASILPHYPGHSTVLRKLTKSYRSTTEINRFAASVLKEKPAYESFERHGKPVTLRLVDSERNAVREIAEILNSLQGVPGATAVVTRTIADAQRFYQMCQRFVPKLRLSDNENLSYEKGMCVIPLSMAKGMEFDRVIIADSSRYGENDDRLLYVALTRAMHELTVFSVKQHSVLLPSEVDQ